MKKILSVLLSTLLIVGSLIGCGSTKTKSEDTEKTTTVLRIAAQPYPLYTPVYVANETASFSSSIQWVHDYEIVLKK